MKYLIIFFYIFFSYISLANEIKPSDERVHKREANKNYDPLEEHKNPSLMDALIDIPIISAKEQFEIDKQNKFTIDDNKYNEIDIVDLYVEKYKYINKNIKMKVSISNDLTQKIFSIFENSSMTGVSFFASNKNVPIDQVKFALKSCSVICNRTFILGKFVNNNGFFKIEIHSLIFPESGLN